MAFSISILANLVWPFSAKSYRRVEILLIKVFKIPLLSEIRSWDNSVKSYSSISGHTFENQSSEKPGANPFFLEISFNILHFYKITPRPWLNKLIYLLLYGDLFVLKMICANTHKKGVIAILLTHHTDSWRIWEKKMKFY